MSYSKQVAEERCLIVLQILDEEPQQRASLGNVYSQLDARLVPGTLVDLQAAVQHLSEQGLIEVQELMRGVTQLSLTQLGAETARGKRTHVGVMRPDICKPR